MGSETVTLTSIHDLIKLLTLADPDNKTPGATSSNSKIITSVIIEGRQSICVLY